MSRCRFLSPVLPSFRSAIFGFGMTLVLLTGLAASPVRAEDEPSAFTLRGFGTLGMARTNSDDAEFVRDLSQPTGVKQKWDGRLDSLLGLQANWQIAPQLEAVIQGVSRYRYDRSFTPEVAWAYLKYDPTPLVSLRAGRLGTEFFMMADSRLVGYSFLTVRPPGDFFWYLPFYSIDGADAVATLPLGDSVLRGKLYYGVSDGNVPLADKQWKIDGSAMTGGFVDYQTGSWLLRVSYANIRFRRNLPIADVLQSRLPAALVPSSMEHLATANTRTHYYSIGAMYDHGPWQFQLMLNQCEQGSEAFESSTSGYALAGYRVGPVTPYLGYSQVSSRARGTTLNPVVAAIMADSHADQRTSIVGARWDVVRNVALKAQWDAIRGDASSIFPYRNEQAGWKGKMDVFSLTMDFVF